MVLKFGIFGLKIGCIGYIYFEDITGSNNWLE